jgi:hypothetical protein
MRTLGIAGIIASWVGFFVCPVTWSIPLGVIMVASVAAAVSET